MRKKLIHQGSVGIILSEGRTCYMVAFPYGVRFVDKVDAPEPEIPLFLRETKAQN